MGFRENPNRYIVFSPWQLKRLIDGEEIWFDDLMTGLFWMPGYTPSSRLWAHEASDASNSENRRYASAMKDIYLSAQILYADREGRLFVGPQTRPSWSGFLSFLRRHHPELAFMELEPEGWLERLGEPGEMSFSLFAEEHTGRIAVL